MSNVVLDNYNERDDLKKYDNNALLLYVLELVFSLDDIHSVAAESLTDNSDDKSCDLIYLDKEAQIAIIAQSYISKDSSKASAKSNKAADLTRAASWLLRQNVDDLPETLKSAGEALVEAIKNEEINAIEFWYVHNLSESENVKQELNKVTVAAKAMLKQYFSEVTIERVTYKEYGVNEISRLYENSREPIKIHKKITVPVSCGFSITSSNYTSFITYLTGDWLKEQYDQFGDDLFFANIRDYLGSKKNVNNINNEIKNTAKEHSEDFFAYNNGITAIVSGMNYSEFEKTKKLEIEGLAIVNGAQTTGSLASSNASDFSKIQVLTRFVRYHDKSVIENIIKYNNTQNNIQASDFRSNDNVQRRLREEFANIQNYEYSGARRGLTGSIAKQSNFLIPTDTVAQAIASFHNEPNIAYNEKKNIWVNDKVYSRYFSDHTTAYHIIFVVSLLKAIETTKTILKQKREKEKTSKEKNLLKIFRKKGSTFLFAAAVANCMEIFTESPIKDTYTIRFKDNKKMEDLKELWKPIIKATSPFISELDPSLDGALKSKDTIRGNIESFSNVVSSTAQINQTIYKNFIKNIIF